MLEFCFLCLSHVSSLVRNCYQRESKRNGRFSSILYLKFANLANLTFRKNTVLSLTLLKHDLHLLFPMDNAR